MKQLWILAGGNGAGKSRFYDTYLKDKELSFVNADRLAKEISEEQTAEVSKAAQQLSMEVITFLMTKSKVVSLDPLRI